MRPGMPNVEDHLVEPEITRDEMVRGRRVIAQPARPPHADRHAKLTYIVDAHATKGYVTSADLLTRVGPRSDFATDTCVRREGTDPTTGVRYLEELAFEIVSTQSMRDITERAEDLANRGLRRLIAIFVKNAAVREWSKERNDWVTLPLDGVLEDPVLVRPIPIRALFDAAVADNAVVRALDAKGNPEIARIKTENREEGLEKGRKEAIEVVCKLLEIPFGPSERAQLESLDAAALEALLARLATDRRWPS
jgi:hypothetical protein